MKKGHKNAETVQEVNTLNENEQNQGLQLVKSDEVKSEEFADFKVIEEPKKVVLGLDETLKVVEDLFRKKRQRDNLEFTSNLLDSFVVEQKEEELDGGHYYTGCLITIKDDNGKEFKTKNPTIIAEVVNVLQRLFVEKLGEIEAQIVLPA